MITKATIAAILGITEATIPDSVFTWAEKQFFLLTGYSKVSVTKTYRKFVNNETAWIKLPDKNISAITTLKLDGVTNTFILNSSLKLNPDSGLVWYDSGFGGKFVEITYTLAAYTALDIHDYLIALLTTKGLSLFKPDAVSQVKMIKIGKYQKQFGSSADNLQDYMSTLDNEIQYVRNIIFGDDGGLATDIIV